MLKLKKLTLILLLTICTLGFSQKQSYIQSFRLSEAVAKEQFAKNMLLSKVQQSQTQNSFDVLYYDINLHMDPSTSTLTGNVLTTAKMTENNIESLDLNLISGLSVDSVLIDGTSVFYSHQNNLLTIKLDRVYSQNETVNVRVYYNGRPNNTGYRSFRFDQVAGKPMIWSLSEPYGARTWWPCKDIPVDKADSVDIKITVPSNLTVVSNGVLVNKNIEGDWTTWWWHEKYPIVTYLVSVAIHPFDYHVDHYLYDENKDPMEIQFYTFGNNWNNYEQQNQQIKEMLATFSELFGQYPFVDEKYGHADYLGGGAMEHQTCSSFSFWGEEVYAHELAHQWWGDFITCESFHHIWLNEGFATYCEALWYEKAYGTNRYKQAMQQTQYFGGGTIYVEDPYNDNIFSGSLSYNKANWVVHMLRHVMGDETFFIFLKEYYKEFAHSTINTSQFKNLAERISNKQLDNFFEQWIFGAGYPQYEFISDFEELENGQYKVSGIIYQKQNGQIFDMPVDLNIHMVRAEMVHVVQVNKRQVPFEIIVDKKPLRLELDEDDWILKSVEKLTDPILTFYDVSVADSSANNNSIWEPGESVDVVVTIQNDGVGVSDIETVITTNDEEVTIIKPTAPIEHISFFSTASNQKSPFVVQALPTAKHHVAEFTLTIKRFGAVLATKTFFLNIGGPRVLVIDDDAGENYELFYKNMAGKANILLESWDVKIKGVPDLTDLNKYMGIIWFTGDETNTAFTTDEQNLISSYLDQGGKALVTGQFIAKELSTAAPDFLQNVLQCEFISFQNQISPVYGLSGDPIGNDIVGVFDNIYYSANNQTGHSIIRPLGLAETCFKYSNNGAAAIRYENTFNNSKLVFFSFALEAIGGPDETTVSAIMEKAVVWLLGSTSTAKNATESMPTNFALHQNYPNPFNPATTITFALPTADNLEISIFNPLGQKVRQLYCGYKNAGWYNIQWDGANDFGEEVSSGLYILFLKSANSHILSTKMLKIQ